MTLIDYQDWQRAVASAGQYLATFTTIGGAINVTLPTNCESLVIISSLTGTGAPSVRGNTTLLYYPIAELTVSGPTSTAWAFKVCPSLDPTVLIAPPAGSPATFYVVSDLGVMTPAPMGVLNDFVGVPPEHVSLMQTGLIGGSDGTNLQNLRVDQQGIAYAIPSAPDTATGDRPPNELQWAVNSGSTATNIVAAPGAGKSLRLFYAKLMLIAATNVVSNSQINVTIGGSLQTICTAGVAIANDTPIPVDTFIPPLTGMLLDTNKAIQFAVAGTSPTSDWVVGYTTETN